MTNLSSHWHEVNIYLTLALGSWVGTYIVVKMDLKKNI